MANNDFELAPSRLQYVLHVTCLGVMLLLWWQMLQPHWVILFGILALMIWVHWLRRAQVTRLAPLSGEVWTLQWQARKTLSTRTQVVAQPVLQQCQLRQVVDHSVYIVLRFDATLYVVIWRDQVSLTAWKQLKLLAKLH